MSSDLQNKLFQFEADPPPEVWNRIDDALDAEETFSQRLFEFEEQPPANVWQNIEASLEENTAFKVVPITRFKKPIRYVAAAASILAAVFLFNGLQNGNTGASKGSTGTETVVAPNQSSVLPTPNLPTIVKANPQPDPVHTSPKEGAVVHEKRRKTLASIRTQAISRSFSFSQNFIPGKADKETLLNFSALDAYMVYSDGNGIAMKLPKKLFSLVNCQDGDESCKERVHQLQSKLANIATTTDFGGILEIVRQLQ